jgi:hypothetical protein
MSLCLIAGACDVVGGRVDWGGTFPLISVKDDSRRRCCVGGGPA